MKKKLWHISKKTTIWLYRFFEAFVAFFLVVFLLAFWKLYTEPMDAKFILPTLEEHLLPQNSGYSLNVESATLSAEFNENGLFHLNMRDLQLIRPDKTVAINLPTVNLSYGFWHVVTLNYMPNMLNVERPDIRLVIDPEGHVLFQAQSELTKTQNTVPTKKGQLMTVRQLLKHALSFYDIAITDGVLMVEDMALQQKLSLPQFELRLHRRYGGLRHTARVQAVAQIDDHLTDIKAKATYGRITKKLNIEAGITPIYLSRFQRFFPLLKGIDLSVSASASAEFNTRKRYKNFAECLEKLKFQIKALKKGVVKLPSPIAAAYQVETAEINGAASAGFKTVKVAKSYATLAAGTKADLEIELKGVDHFIQTHNIDDVKTVLNATVKDVEMKEVPKVWPKEQGTDAHEWVEKHLSKGRVPEADFQLTFKGGALIDVFGDVKATGVRVDYLPDMPAIENASAQVLLYPNKVEIFANKGNAGKVELMNAKLLFAPLDADPTYLDILLDLKGPIAPMLHAINEKPLELLKGIDYDWNRLTGEAQTRVKLNFPLDEEKLVPDLKVDVVATSTDVGLSLADWPIQLNNGKINLHVDNKGLKLDGVVDFHNQTVNFVWTEDFTPQKGTNSKYEGSGIIAASTLNELVPDIESYVTGAIPVKVTLERKAPKRLWEGSARLDLVESKVVLHPLDVIKAVGEKAILSLSLNNTHENFGKGEGSFDLEGMAQAEQLKIKGNVNWGKEWGLVLDEVTAPKNKFTGHIARKENALMFVLNGESWNLSKIKEMPILLKEAPEGAPIEKTTLPPNISMEAKLTKLILNKEKPMENVILNAERKENIWKYFQAEANAKEPFVIVYNPEKKVFSGEFEDLGALMSHLGVSDRFSGGKLRMVSKQEDDGNIKGKIKVFETELNETGFLLQAVSILGIVDAIRGKNIVFNEIQIPFEFAPEGEFKLSDAYAASSNIGVTFKGIINLNALDLEGAVIPAYAVNSLPGKIPLIGALFREGEGGGLIGVKYSVKGRPTKPEVEFHPLSSMAPGALGYIF